MAIPPHTHTPPTTLTITITMVTGLTAATRGTAIASSHLAPCHVTVMITAPVATVLPIAPHTPKPG